MHLPYTLPTILALQVAAVRGDFITPTYPTPADLSSSQSLVQSGWKSLTSSFDQYLQGKLNDTAAAAFAGVENVTFSMGMFSLNDPKALKLQYHYTAPEVKSAKVGTNKVDEDSIYRVASVSKLITVFTSMVELSEEDWDRPLTQINPAFKRKTDNATGSDPINAIQWDKITPRALASQISGIPTLGFFGDRYNASAAAQLGGPLINGSDLGAFGPCAAKIAANPDHPSCSGADIIGSVRDAVPNFLPWMTPVYSDLNFILLGIVIANITDKPISEVYQSAVFEPLGMSSSNVKSTNKTLPREVVVGTPKEYHDLDKFPPTAPSGGILSTLSDLQKFGLGILNHTLLSREATDKWMKPFSHTGSLTYSIGAPWEIHRFVHPKSGRVTDIYTKLGDAGNHGGGIALIPQYNAGFAMLNGADAAKYPLRSTTALHILDFITATVVPALEAEALAEAKRNFVGEYKSSSGSVESTLTIGINASSGAEVHSDLVVKEWKYDGTDVLAGDFFANKTPRLEQSIVRYYDNGKPRQIAFLLSTYPQTTTYMEATKMKETGVLGTWSGLYYSNGDYTFTDLQRWSGSPVRELIFDIDSCGKVVKCTPTFQGIELKKSKN